LEKLNLAVATGDGGGGCDRRWRGRLRPAVEGAEAVGTGGGRGGGDQWGQRQRRRATAAAWRQREGAAARPSRLDSRHREGSPLVTG
jgi:hypothetical protein